MISKGMPNSWSLTPVPMPDSPAPMISTLKFCSTCSLGRWRQWTSKAGVWPRRISWWIKGKYSSGTVCPTQVFIMRCNTASSGKDASLCPRSRANKNWLNLSSNAAFKGAGTSSWKAQGPLM